MEDLRNCPPLEEEMEELKWSGIWGMGLRGGGVSGVIHFYYRSAPPGRGNGKLFLKQSGGARQSHYLPCSGPRRNLLEGDSGSTRSRDER